MAKGNIETVLFLVVALVALVGVALMFKSTMTGADIVPVQDQPGLNKLPMMDCQAACMGQTPGEHYQTGKPLGGSALRACLAQCQQQMNSDLPSV